MSTSNSNGSGLATNLASALCYAFSLITGIIFLVLDKDKKEVKFHAWQAIILGAPLVVFWILSSIIVSIFWYGTLVTLFSWLAYLVSIAWFITSVICALKAYQNEKFKIPFIGDIAEQMAAK